MRWMKLKKWRGVHVVSVLLEWKQLEFVGIDLIWCGQPHSTLVWISS